VDLSPAQPVTFLVGTTPVSGLWQQAPDSWALYVMAHGAGAGMRHAFMGGMAEALALQGISSLRYQFPYMEKRGKRPDSPALCQATVRAAVSLARTLAPELPLIAGGKSFGGRMTSQAQADSPLEGIKGLAFLGFPLHPPKQPSATRADHLAKVDLPMLFVQGTRDALADPAWLGPVVERLGARARLSLVEGADHAFHVPVRARRSDSDVLAELASILAAWSRSTIG